MFARSREISGKLNSPGVFTAPVTAQRLLKMSGRSEGTLEPRPHNPSTRSSRAALAQPFDLTREGPHENHYQCRPGCLRRPIARLDVELLHRTHRNRDDHS